MSFDLAVSAIVSKGFTQRQARFLVRVARQDHPAPGDAPSASHDRHGRLLRFDRLGPRLMGWDSSCRFGGQPFRRAVRAILVDV